jgi:hypothetical protein
MPGHGWAVQRCGMAATVGKASACTCSTSASSYVLRLVPVCRCKVVHAPQVVRILRAQYSLPHLQHRLNAPGRSHCTRSRLFFFGITGYPAGTTTNRLIGLDKRPGRNSDIWLKKRLSEPLAGTGAGAGITLWESVFCQLGLFDKGHGNQRGTSSKTNAAVTSG